MSNNAKIEALRIQINELEIKNRYETNPLSKIELYHEEIELRQQYTQLLLKKRPLLLTLGISLAIFYGVSLIICLPPYIIRGKKRDINEEKIRKIKSEINCLEAQL